MSSGSATLYECSFPRYPLAACFVRHLSPLSLLGSVGGNAWFCVSCTDPLMQEQLDPIVSLGGNFSQHVHTIHGASSRVALRQSLCIKLHELLHRYVTNPEYYPQNIHGFLQDFLNYWFPKLYFQDLKTKLFKPVGNGGLLVYYQNRGNRDKSNGGAGLKAFPPGLRMITGDLKRHLKKFPIGKGSQEELPEQAIQWSYSRFTLGLLGYDDNGTGFPTTDCESGLNARLHSSSYLWPN
ncbi:WSC domain protein [Mycena venus]|uniref:WSC domain protein n=1 Tax=Mycena venus TaxID=2733690 RepID=A0A8H6Y0X3_9AGAR|nr:WSC domain protein [Mycena venus]